MRLAWIASARPRSRSASRPLIASAARSPALRSRLHVVVGEVPFLERAHVKHADHGALDDQRNAEQRLEALLAQQRVDDLGVFEVGDAHRLARAGDATREALAYGDAHPLHHLLLEALRGARHERAAVVLEQEDRRGVHVEDVDDSVEELVEEPVERKVRERGVRDALQVTELVAPGATGHGAAFCQSARVAAWENHAMSMRTVMRTEDRVTPLELFFDLVFVLALTQCTALMADDPTWEGLGQGLLVLGVLWWAWVGYAWLTSVVDPEEGAVRLVDVRRDGRAARGRAVRARGVRRARRCCSPAPTRIVRFAQIVAVRAREPRRPRAAPLGHRAWLAQHRRRRRAAGGGLASPTARSRARSGRSRWRSTWAARC